MSSSTPYLHDLSQFETALQATLEGLLGPQLDRVRSLLSSANLVSVGAGGTAPVATLAAQAHIDATGRGARAMPPLLFLQERNPPMEEVVLLFSAQARHRDTEAVVTAARRSNRRVVLVTQRSGEELGHAFDEAILLRIPTIEKRDGFLATKSLISMAGVIWTLYGDPALTTQLHLNGPMTSVAIKSRLLVTFGRDERAAAEDIEVRLSELGLADVQLADYRTLAHGRHLGLSRRLDDTTLIALSSPSSADIAGRTLRVLPHSLDVVRLMTERDGLIGAVELLAAAAMMPVYLADRQNVSLTKPAVSIYGRNLYHLTAGSALRREMAGPVAKKLASLDVSSSQPAVKSMVARAYETWRSAIVQHRFDTLVLDYDGTVVSTDGRFQTPSAAVRQEIIRLLEQGADLVFASGRGDSLRRSLEEWIPQALQPRVQLGLHNGSWSSGLGVAQRPEPSDDMLANVREALEELGVELGDGVRVRSTPGQITFQTDGVGLSVGGLRNVVQSFIDTLASAEEVRAVSSAHSVDVISGKGKIAVLEGISLERTLLVGDQGQGGGNDHELLGASRWSISVDATSGALDRCWAASPMSAGPDSTRWLLSRIQPEPRGFKLHLPRGK